MFKYLIQSHDSEWHFLPLVKMIPFERGQLILAPLQSSDASGIAIFASKTPKCKSKWYSVRVESWGPGKVAWPRAVCSLAAPGTLPSDYIRREGSKKGDGNQWVMPIQNKRCSREMKTYVYTTTCTWTFTAAVFIITPTPMSSVVNEYTDGGSSTEKTAAQGQTNDTRGWASNASCSVEAARCKRLQTVWSHSYSIQKKAKLWGQRTALWLAGDGGVGRIWLQSGSTREFWGVMKLFCILIVVVVPDSCQNSYDCLKKWILLYAI